MLGGGTAGITAAEIAQANGKSVVLIEQARIGGECTWDGCVPSKALLQAARLRHDCRRAEEFGLRVTGVDVDFPAVMASVQEDRGIAVRRGHAKLTAPHTLAVNGDQIYAERIILCTGSRPSVPPIPGLAEVPYLTNENLFELRSLPGHLLILGAGATGLEMGQAFRRLGSRVTVMEMGQDLLPREDADIAACARQVLEGEGVRLMMGARTENATCGGGSVTIDVVVDGHRRTVEGDTLLVATGRRPNIENIGLEALGIEAGNQGIVVNEKLETSVEEIYAAGDVTGIYPFTHVAAYQARIAANNATGIRGKADYRVVPWVIFTDPEIAHVGLTEAEARQKHGDDIHVVTLPFTAIDRAVIERRPRGIIKIIVGKKPLIGYALGEGEVIGAHLIGANAGELAHEFVISMQARTFSGRLAQAIHAYPTMSIGVQQAAGLLFPSGRATVVMREDIIPLRDAGSRK